MPSGVEDLLRELAPQVTGLLARRYGDFDAAEDAVQEALLAAAVHWPRDGVPDQPYGWLVRTATRRLIDLRRSERSRRDREVATALREPPPADVPDRDDTLVLLFLCCHPSLTAASAIALTLRAVGGLGTAEIASAFLVPEATMAQRISRAKQKIKASGEPFRLPAEEERAARLRLVLHVLYLIFNEGYASSGGEQLHRAELSGEAVRLTRAVHRLLPSDDAPGVRRLASRGERARTRRRGDHHPAVTRRPAASYSRAVGLTGVSELFDPKAWGAVDGFGDLTDITYHRLAGGGPVVRVAFDRPEVRNAFRPHTVDELYRVLDHARRTPDVGCVLITGNGPSPRDGGWAFCSGGDQRIRGRTGYQYAADGEAPDPAAAGRLHILEVQRLIRFMPKVVIAVVPGWAAGGGHSLHAVCDLTLASAEHARFKQTDADVGSFDGGYGSAYLARQVGQKFAREIFFLGRAYDAAAAHRMGMVNEVVPHAELESVAIEWGLAICAKSPTAQRMLKYAFNAVDDGLVGQQVFAGEATRLAYMTEEALEGRDAFLEKRAPDWSRFPYYY